ncbi:uncharacterized protein KQ657_003223 [Scheffersomyces spartinae]|uniref:Cation efflux protein transmembrane domain-containing protein n=1 Tax=Scheffersomyces spartinae TaxID=45513 RepID=A0A9P7VDS8_9ASCO|nr:uncharacterized protein KQ657_003223 [Scheffersomyces spartinae]KAG7195461.1 hypothetical protein KQ657_003223 [Scheffersomyces spartinae]
MSGKQIRIISLLVLDTAFFLLEAIVGYSVHSLALVADSFHMLNDIISLIIALWAVRVKETRKACGKYTYGWQRAEILGALINAVFLLALCFTIIIEAIQRFFEPQVISNPKLILAVGCAGLASNFLGLVLFHEHGHSHSHGGSGSGHSHSHDNQHDEESAVQSSTFPKPSFPAKSGSSSDISSYLPDRFIENYNERSGLLPKSNGINQSHPHSNENEHSPAAPKRQKSMNMEGVFLHVLGDALGNIGVICAALFIWKTDYSWRYYTDPIISLVITVIIFSSALPLCKKSAKILLQASPPYLNSEALIQEIITLDSIKSLHDFHVWNLNEDILIASLHLELVSNTDDCIKKTDFLSAVGQVREILHRYGIHSATIQPEFGELQIVEEAEFDSYGAITKDHCQLDEVANCSDACLRQ